MSEVNDPEPFRIPDYDNDLWTVSVSKADPVHVGPSKGLLGMENWAMEIHKPWRDLTVRGVIRYFSGIDYRRSYPKNEKQLRKAIEDCEVWCANQNMWEERQRRLVRRFAG